jgi:bifunctional DNase/RNase
MEQELNQYTVAGVLLHREDGIPLISLRKRSDGSYLHIQAAPAEAGAILLELKKAYLPYPNAHDLLASFFLRHRFKGKRLVITALSAKLPGARFEYRRGLRTFTEDLRPADGIALALRIGLPIYITSGAARQDDLKAEEPSESNVPEEPYLYIEEQAHRA